jgi:hypothetical protein
MFSERSPRRMGSCKPPCGSLKGNIDHDPSDPGAAWGRKLMDPISWTKGLEREREGCLGIGMGKKYGKDGRNMEGVSYFKPLRKSWKPNSKPFLEQTKS